MAIQERVVPYGEQHPVEVLMGTRALLSVKALDTGERYWLIGHGIKPVPLKGARGVVTFARGGPNGGFWDFKSDET